MVNQRGESEVSDSNSVFSVAISSIIGDREDQQDSFGYSLSENGGMIVVCDGMGGYDCGRAASDTAVRTFISDYGAGIPDDQIVPSLLNSARDGDEKIASMTDAAGEPVQSGSTCVAVVVRGGKLYWCSVGDSRAYLMRGDAFIQLTLDQNYETVLTEKLNAGLITAEEYESELPQGGALVSYLGIGALALIDHSDEPIALNPKDKIVIMTDGLYKILSDSEIGNILRNFRESKDALLALNMKAARIASKAGKARDNTTIAIISVK